MQNDINSGKVRNVNIIDVFDILQYIINEKGLSINGCPQVKVI